MSAAATPAPGEIKRPELHTAIADLAKISLPEGRGVTREVFTPGYEESVQFTAALMREAGLEVRTDSFGNLWGRWEGSDSSLPRVLTGSHIDTTLDAGAYDGVLGVLGPIAAVGELRRAGFVPRRTIEVIAFAGEEPRFGSGCIGSRALMGRLSRDDLDTMVDRDGISIAAAMRDSGLDPDRIADARIDSAGVHAFVELHIEQGEVLERDGFSIGIVHRIAAPHDLRVRVIGKPGHAGATPMRLRADALAGAVEAIALLEQLAIQSPSDSIVATVGKLDVLPGAINVIPGEVVFDLDVRDSEEGPRETVIAAFREQLDAIAQRRGLTVSVEQITLDSPASCAPLIVEAVTGAAEAAGAAAAPIISGAFHDAMIMAREMPIGMIFVPSRDGLSHHPDEYTAPEDIDLGVDVLAGTLQRLAAD